MGLSTAIIGIIPTYAQIGLAAAVILFTLRLIQGLCLGGEYGGAITYVAEHITDDKRGYYTGWLQTSPTGDDPASDKAPERARPLAASGQQHLACDERAGPPGRRRGAGFGDAGETPPLSGPRCASVNGCSLHANPPMPAHRRDQWERRSRSTARGAVALERLAHDASGDLL